jgi:flagellar protein FlaI
MDEVLEEYNGVRIVSRGEGKTPLYRVDAFELSPEGQGAVERIVRTMWGRDVVPQGLRGSTEEDQVLRTISDELLDSAFDPEEQNRIALHAFYSLTSVGPLQFLLNDDQLEEVMVTGTDFPVYVFHRRFGMCETNLSLDASKLKWVVERISTITGGRIDLITPLLDASLPDGSRVNATIPPATVDGPSITIRKFRKEPLTVVDLLEKRTLSPNLAAFLWMCIEGLDSPPNILIGGGAGTGKTTLLNVISSFIPSNERVITIEDTLELYLPIPHRVRLLTRPPNIEGKGEITADILLKNVLRMRPDRIIMGEIRGIEARTLFNAMNTGHKGVMGTLHANTAPEVISRVVNPPMDVPKNMLTSLDIVILIENLHDKGGGLIRRITDVSEVRFSGGETVKLNKLYRRDSKEDLCKPTGIPGRLELGLTETLRMKGREYREELGRREKVLEWMQKKGITKMEEVLKVIEEYRTNPEALVASLDGGSAFPLVK